jgi:hypothetical protein
MTAGTVTMSLVTFAFSVCVPGAIAEECANYSIDPRLEPYPTYKMDVVPWTVIADYGTGCSDRDLSSAA